MPEPASLTAGTRRRRWLTVLLMVLGVLLSDVPVALAAGGSGWMTLPSLTAPRAFLATANGPCPRGEQGPLCIYAIGGRSSADGPATGRVEAYNPAANDWVDVAPLPEPRQGLAAAAAPCPPGEAGTCVYAIGGRSTGVGGTPTSTVEAYDPALNRWIDVASLPEPRQDLAAVPAPCPMGDGLTCIYAIGGDTTQAAEVQAYDPAADVWSEVAPLPTPRVDPAAAAAPCPPGETGTCVYAYGGLSTGSGSAASLDTVESYNPATRAWTGVASMNEPRAVLGGSAGPCPRGEVGTACLYAVGGQDGGFNPVLGSVESYNPITDGWTSLPWMAMPTPLVEFAASFGPCPAGETGTCAYTIGGVDPSSQFVSTLQAFHIVA